MKPEYDFSEGERGRFFRPNAEPRLPIYLGADVQTYLAERAATKGFLERLPACNGIGSVSE